MEGGKPPPRCGFALASQGAILRYPLRFHWDPGADIRGILSPMEPSMPSPRAIPSPSFPGEAVLPDACREAERHAKEAFDIPEDDLVEQASLGAWKVFCALFPEAHRFAVLCGPGSNGADGLALARHALRDGFHPVVASVGKEPDPSGAAGRQRVLLREAGATPIPWSKLRDMDEFRHPTGMPAVDAMFGTGLSRPLQGDAIEAARWLSDRPTLALDIPSGLDGATGQPLGEAVRATATVAFGRTKPGLHLHPGRDFAGAVHLVQLGIPPASWEHAGGAIGLLDDAWAAGRLAPRPRGAHKGDAGRVFLLVGSDAYPGAAFLSIAAALRSGAGLLFAGSTESVASRVPLAVPEAIASIAIGPEVNRDELARRIESADAVLAGPGLGMSADSASTLRLLLARARGPLVLDADALNLCAAHPDLQPLLLHAADARGVVLTPHPMEASRLAGRTVDELLADPIGAARELAARFHAVVVFKTSTPVVASPSGQLAIGIAGHSGMAVGGCGDALAGALVARLAEGATPFDAACQAVRAHARAGDLAGRRGHRGMSVTDLISSLPQAWEEMESAAGDHSRPSSAKG